MNVNFFSDAPVVNWLTYSWRLLWGTQEPVKTISSPRLALQIRQDEKESYYGYDVNKLQSTSATEYCNFLKQYYYNTHHKHLMLDVPIKLLETNLSLGCWTGIEMRKDGELVGLVFSHYAGSWKETPMGLITWLCIKPDYRKKGLVNVLLRAMYALNQPTTVYWWRTDGRLKSLIPPVLTQHKILRKSTVLMGVYSPLRKVNNIQGFVESWKQQNPGGFLLYSEQYTNQSLAVFEYRQSETEFVQVAFLPTFEAEKRISNVSYVEVVGWISAEGLQDMKVAMCIEILIDAVNLGDWYEAPVTMPHLQFKDWKPAGVSSWSVFGLDMGTANSVPILPLAAA